MRTNRKGQAAIEFLTTYGWMFLVILLVIGGLAYFDVFNVNRLVPEGCSIEGTAFSCSDIFAITEPTAIADADETVEIQLTNNLQRQITISDIQLIERSLDDGQFTGACTMTPVPASIGPGTQQTLTLTADAVACGISANDGQKKTFDFIITYAQQGAGGITQIVRGSITATVQ